MNFEKIIIRFEDEPARQTYGSVRRLVGFVRAKNMLSLLDAANLDANPRLAKAGNVTAAIIDSIEKDPGVFPFKTKGILVGSTEYEELQRSRYELRFNNPAIEGVLDGGHNMLAIGMHILNLALQDEKVTKKIKFWDDFRKAWVANRAAITAIRDDLDFMVPIEVLVPSDQSDDEVIYEFKSSLLEICAARNNNAELTSETKANQKGYYEELKKALPPTLRDRIEWKTNMAGGDIKARDIIALSWIPLSLLTLPGRIKAPPPQSIYNSKGECVKLFGNLMDDPTVSKAHEGSIHELHSTAVGSAITILGSLPELYDRIYADFPYAYNASGGSFGRLKIVRMYDPNMAKQTEKNPKYLRTQPETHFTEKPVDYSYPDGLILPLVSGLRALMAVNPSGHIKWAIDPHTFLDAHFDEIVVGYKLVLEMSGFDPQKVGKNETSYKIARSEFEKVFFKSQAQLA